MNYRDKIQLVRSEYLHGNIDLDMAKKVIQPMLDEMNKKAEKIAKDNGKKWHKLTFGYIFR